MKKQTFPKTRTAFAVLSLCAALNPLTAFAVDSFEVSNNRLNMEAVTTGGQTYFNVGLTINAYSVLGVDGGAPLANSFDAASKVLTLGAVTAQGTTYNNVRVRVDAYDQLSAAGPVQASTLPNDLANAFNHLNADRLRCGFGPLKQSTQLDQVAANHLNFRAINAPAYADSRAENPGLPGVTGGNAGLRAAAVGYQTNSEVLEGIYGRSGLFPAGSTKNQTAAYDRMRDLMASAYSGLWLFSNATEVGMGVRTSTNVDAAGPKYFNELDVNVGYGTNAAGQSAPAGTGLRTYPCEGSTNVKNYEILGSTYGGTPFVSYMSGPPIVMVGEAGKVLEILDVTVTSSELRGAQSAKIVRTKANDPNPSFIQNAWSGYMLIDSPLGRNSRYTVTINYKSGGMQGKPYTFTFTAGSDNAFER